MTETPEATDLLNPDVAPARPWEWSAFASTVLVFLEEIGPSLVGIPDAPRWAVVVAAAIPWVVRFGRLLLTKTPVSYRRT